MNLRVDGGQMSSDLRDILSPLRVVHFGIQVTQLTGKPAARINLDIVESGVTSERLNDRDAGRYLAGAAGDGR